MSTSKSRALGSDVPKNIKTKIFARQLSNLDVGFGELKESLADKYGIDNDFSDYMSDFKTRDGGGIDASDLSSRTPFVRLWTALSISNDIIHETIDKKADFDQTASGNANKWLKATPGGFEVHEWVDVEASQKIYILGNHILNTFETDPMSQRTTGRAGDISGYVMKQVLPHPQESDNNMYLEPPAGITGLTSTIDGTADTGAVRTTTIEFTVHNMADFKNIYLRYFLRPSAQVFVDFGWDTADLYDPEDLLASVNIDDFLYGKTGSVTKSNGDLETLMGSVVNYDVTVREDGGYDCSLEIMSNGQKLLSGKFEPSFKDKIKNGLDIEILGYGLSNVLQDPFFEKASKQWNRNPENLKKLRKELASTAITLLGSGDGANQPGFKDNDSSMLALRHGVFNLGTSADKSELYINFGWFEDKFLNKELGFSDSTEALINSSGDGAYGDEGNLFAKFNSRNSFAKWDAITDALHFDGKYKNNPVIIYPCTWGSAGPTYNTNIGMVPDRYDENGQLIVLTDYEATLGERTYTEKLDKEAGRIPFRELFISVRMIKDAVVGAKNSLSFIKAIIKGINLDLLFPTNNGTAIGLKSNSYGQHTMAFVDKTLPGVSTSTAYTKLSLESEFYKNLLTFTPHAPTTIVKDFTFSFTIGGDDIANAAAAQTLNEIPTDEATNGSIFGYLSLEKMLREHDFKNKKVLYRPSQGTAAGDRLLNSIRKTDAGNFSFGGDDQLFGDTKVGMKKKYGEGYKNLVNGVVLKSMPVEKDATGEDVKPSDEKLEAYREDMRKQLGVAAGISDTKDGKQKEIPRETIDKKYLPGDDDKISESSPDDQLAHALTMHEELVSTPEEFWTRLVKENENSLSSAEIFGIEATLTIYGISGLQFGDLFKIDYLPDGYKDKVYFQINNVTHTIGESWDTEITSFFRILPKSVTDTTTSLRVGIDYISHNYGALEGGNFQWAFGNLKPLLIRNIKGKKPKFIEAMFKCYMANDYNGGATIEFPTIWTFNDNDEMGNVIGALNTEQGDNSIVVKAEYTDEFPADGGFWNQEIKHNKHFPPKYVTSGCKFTITAKRGDDFYLILHENKKNWIVWPTDPSSTWKTIDELFRLAIVTPPLVNKPVPEPEGKTPTETEKTQSDSEDELEEKENEGGGAGKPPPSESDEPPPPPVKTMGCTNPEAENYDPTAEIDDNSCDYGPEPERVFTDAELEPRNASITLKDQYNLPTRIYTEILSTQVEFDLYDAVPDFPDGNEVEDFIKIHLPELKAQIEEYWVWFEKQ